MRSALIWLLSLIVSLLVVPLETLRAADVSSNYISGRVVSGSSKPARSLWVILSVGATQKGRSLTGDDGKYYIGGLAKGTYTIAVRKQPAGVDLFQSQVSLPQNKIYNVKIPSERRLIPK